MPASPDTGPDAGSNLVSGDGTNVATFTLPSAPRYVVQSVVATVDNSAGGDTTATLTMADSNGAVIAEKAQGDTIPAGNTGTATFARRLTDSPNLRGVLRFDVENTGLFLHVTAADVTDTVTQQRYIFLGVGSSFTVFDSNNLNLLDITEAGQINIYPGASGLTIASNHNGNMSVGVNEIFLNLPVAPGTAGSLWNNGGIVQVA